MAFKYSFKSATKSGAVNFSENVEKLAISEKNAV